MPMYQSENKKLIPSLLLGALLLYIGLFLILFSVSFPDTISPFWGYLYFIVLAMILYSVQNGSHSLNVMSILLFVAIGIVVVFSMIPTIIPFLVLFVIGYAVFFGIVLLIVFLIRKIRKIPFNSPLRLPPQLPEMLWSKPKVTAIIMVVLEALSMVPCLYSWHYELSQYTSALGNNRMEKWLISQAFEKTFENIFFYLKLPIIFTIVCLVLQLVFLLKNSPVLFFVTSGLLILCFCFTVSFFEGAVPSKFTWTATLMQYLFAAFMGGVFISYGFYETEYYSRY